MGGGDPNLSARAIPYRMGPVTGNPLAAIEDLADQVAARGVKRIDGGIIGDDTWYVWQPFAEGWAIDDPQYDVRRAGLGPHRQRQRRDPRRPPGRARGRPGRAGLEPAAGVLPGRQPRPHRGGGRRAQHPFPPRSRAVREVRLWGSIPLRDRGEDLVLGIEDPALYAAQALRQALEERGVSVGGGATALHAFPDETPDLTQAPAPPAWFRAPNWRGGFRRR